MKQLNNLHWQTEGPDLNIYANRQLIKVRASLGLSPQREAETEAGVGVFNLMVLAGIMAGQALDERFSSVVSLKHNLKKTNRFAAR